jgi:hypothetical protein
MSSASMKLISTTRRSNSTAPRSRGHSTDVKAILTVVEQMDRAADELSADDSISSRLALILIDNVTELLVHDRLRSHLRWEFVYKNMKPGQVSAARGNDFDERLKVLRDMGDLTDRERRFVSECHVYRNELYHVGLRHEGIIRAVAGAYYGFACDLLGRIPPAGRSWGTGDTVTDRAARHFPVGLTAVTILGADIRQVASSLASALPPGVMPAAPVLAAELLRSIDEVEQALGCIVTDHPARLSRADAIRSAQFESDFYERLANAGLAIGYRTSRHDQESERLLAEMKAAWRPRHRDLPLQRWRSKAGALAKERDDMVAMAMHQDLRESMLYLEEAIGDEAARVEEWIQFQIDQARGK